MAKHLYIEGVVQGVGYRASFAALANSLGVSGWVRNRMDGAVEAVVDGSDEALARLIQWAHRGPPAARVTQLALTDAVDDTGLPGIPSGRLDILPTV